jgi:hypothetical protein
MKMPPEGGIFFLITCRGDKLADSLFGKQFVFIFARDFLREK